MLNATLLACLVQRVAEAAASYSVQSLVKFGGKETLEAPVIHDRHPRLPNPHLVDEAVPL
jgi:hypothetical protein